MTKQHFVELLQKQLQKELSSLTSWNVVGARSIETIIDELEDNLLHTVQVVYNDRFELVFNKKSNELQFKTTYSNQLIDEAFMNEMLRINQLQGLIGSIIKSIVEHS